jgi:hypothetical protein
MKTFMPDATPDERLRIMRENSDHIETTEYYRSLTYDEMVKKNKEFLSNCAKLGDLEEHFDQQKKQFKLQADPLKTENKTLLYEVRTGKTKVSGELFHMADYEGGIMETYDANGEFLESRRLLPDERKGYQPRLFIAKGAEGDAAKAAGE